MKGIVEAVFEDGVFRLFGGPTFRRVSVSVSPSSAWAKPAQTTLLPAALQHARIDFRAARRVLPQAEGMHHLVDDERLDMGGIGSVHLPECRSADEHLARADRREGQSCRVAAAVVEPFPERDSRQEGPRRLTEGVEFLLHGPAGGVPEFGQHSSTGVALEPFDRRCGRPLEREANGRVRIEWVSSGGGRGLAASRTWPSAASTRRRSGEFPNSALWRRAVGPTPTAGAVDGLGPGECGLTSNSARSSSRVMRARLPARHCYLNTRRVKRSYKEL